MRQFRLLAYPEQVISAVRSGVMPVVPLWFPRDDLNRIVPWLTRKGTSFGIAFERQLVAPERLAEGLRNAGMLLCFSPDTAEEARRLRFSGEIVILANSAMLSFPRWFRDLAVRPVVKDRTSWEAARDLDPYFFVTTKSCVAEWGACRSRNGLLQQFIACDNRCREKTRERSSVDSPLSISPVTRFPETATDLLLYDEENGALLAPRVGNLPSDDLHEAGGYVWPIGHRIVTEGHRTNDGRFYFNLHAEESKLWEEGRIRFWAYRRNLYDGGWADTARATRAKGRLLVSLPSPSPARKLLMVEVRTAGQYDEFKRARHQIYTMPLDGMFSSPETKIIKDEGGGTTRSEPPRRVTLVLDDLDHRSFFRSRDIARVALLYTGGPVSRFFDHYLYLPFPVAEEILRMLVSHRRLRGFVVQDRLFRRKLEEMCRGEKEVFLHPMFLEPEETGPSCIVACEQAFRSRYRVSGRARKGWAGLRIKPYPVEQGTLFLRETPWFREGDLPELWVDIIGALDPAIRAVKVRTEQMLRGKQHPSE